MSRIAIFVGLPGAGKSTLAKALLGEGPEVRGSWTVARGGELAALGRFDVQPYGVDALATWLPRTLGEQELPAGRVEALARVCPVGLGVLDNVRFDLPTFLEIFRGEVVGVDIQVSHNTCVARRSKRGLSRPMPFNWWATARGRVTNNIRTMVGHGCRVITVQGEGCTDEQCQMLRTELLNM